MSSFLARRAFTAAPAARAFSTSSPRGLARLTIVGNLGDAPELTPTSTGHELIRYSVATSSGPKDNRHTSWFRVSKFLREGDEKRRDFLLSLPKG
ncbi:single-stranded DNA-binding protein [Candidatus Bathyarchaeota archaeon]|nr:single-stranded DNA-binding protein [Candidatus Bathyarchaeota archaeon]